MLRRYDRLLAGRYALKRAMSELGPSGYPFENLVAAMFAAEGFEVKVDAVVSGKCVAHEIDVIAKKNDRQFVIECKYHNQPGIRSDVKVALYVWARFLDLTKFDEAWLVTNTKFTNDAARYAECVGMRVVGWNYPTGDSLEKRIDRLGLHPLTCLTSLSRGHKQQLLGKGLALARDLEANRDALAAVGLGDDKIALVLNEARLLSNLS
jgi:Holliday junction resolvase-like predicted endonuclease